MAYYEFETVIRLRAPAESVFELMMDFGSYAQWWPAIKKVRVLATGSEAGIGRCGEYRVKSPLGYSLRCRAEVVAVEYPVYARFASSGDLVGYGEYLVSGEDGVTTVVFPWRVATTKAWMNALAPVARPFFEWAHNSVSEGGGRGLAERLGAELVSVESRVVRKRSVEA